MNGPAQERVQQLLDRLVASDQSSGLQVAAYLDGRLVVDAWAGEADPATGRKVDGETLFPVFSTSKGIAATAVHRLVERGVLDYDAPIARWWPEFAAHGKGGITLRHAMDHTAGVPQMPEHGTLEDFSDWDGMCRKIADLEPLWPPGERTFYHAISYSWTLGEVARRADGRDFMRIIDEEISRPLGLTGLFIGIPDRVEHLVTPIESRPAPPPAQPAAPAKALTADELISQRSIPPWVLPLERMLNHRGVRRACVPASNGIMNARSIARHYAALVGEVDGVRLIGERTLAEATRQAPAPAGGTISRRGLGYGLYGPEQDPGAAFGHGGYGGSLGMADRRTRLAYGFARRRMSDPGAADVILAEIRAALGLPPAP
jgi:CubicO group peptidase (beta-lactamase class C family)